MRRTMWIVALGMGATAPAAAQQLPPGFTAGVGIVLNRPHS